jgi:hypothetical protein
MYGIDPTATNRIVFVAIAVVHGSYASFWDVYYDWTLGHAHSDYSFLRQSRAYKKVWVYYAAIALNGSLRFSWVLYTVVPPQDHHSALASFGVSLGKVFRRGVWLLIRVESERCTSFGYPRPCACSSGVLRKLQAMCYIREIGRLVVYSVVRCASLIVYLCPPSVYTYCLHTAFIVASVYAPILAGLPTNALSALSPSYTAIPFGIAS